MTNGTEQRGDIHLPVRYERTRTQSGITTARVVRSWPLTNIQGTYTSPKLVPSGGGVLSVLNRVIMR